MDTRPAPLNLEYPSSSQPSDRSGAVSTCRCEYHCQKCSGHEPLNEFGFCEPCLTWLPWATSNAPHHLLTSECSDFSSEEATTPYGAECDGCGATRESACTCGPDEPDTINSLGLSGQVTL